MFHFDGGLMHGTYYGGDDDDGGYGIAVAPGENGREVYVAGYTYSANTGDAIADDGTTLSGQTDAFVVRLTEELDDRVWGTYFGGEGEEEFNDIEYDGEGLVLSGSTNSSTGVATPDGHQTAFGGFYDAMFVAMDPADGSPYYATYIGGNDLDLSFAVAGSPATAAVGSSVQSSGLASAGAWDTSLAGAFESLYSYFRMYTP